ncbi:MAG: nucleotide exchange factor GrpE [Elusimicrobia bacterium]|nr:nucleotide exchange factor GrpE [Elusimicrobiota bacterium]
MSKDVDEQQVPAEEPIPAADAVVEKAPEPDYYSQLLRLKAEFENYRKRVDREKPDWYKLGAAGVLAKLLPLYDLLRHAHQDINAGHADTPLAKGMEAIFREYDKLFKEEGVTKMDPLGKPFDPHYHEAFGFVNKPGFEEGAVADVLQAGFLLGDKVLRTAKVRLQKDQKKSTEA